MLPRGPIGEQRRCAIIGAVPPEVLANLLILIVVLIGPFVSHQVERNLEAFLFIMGVLSALASRVLTLHLIGEAARHPVPITIAVFISGIIFTWGRERFVRGVSRLLAHVAPVFLAAAATAVLGLASSVITAIIAALVLVEFITALRLPRSEEIRLVVIACYSIGLGAALTPIGEPLSTIATAKLGKDFWYLARLLAIYIVPGVLALGAWAAVSRGKRLSQDGDLARVGPGESYGDVTMRAARVYLFVMALTLLGEGFRPLIDRYVIELDSRLLYWINIVSAVLDNATLTAAEISPRMTEDQVRAILMGLLISGGMLIPGNIPNIIAAGKLGIRSREWAVAAVPIGMVLLVVYFVVLFFL
jgi:predicted cation transporter